MGKKKPTFFMKRGKKIVSIKLDDWDEPIDITVCVPTNRQHDEMMELHTEYGTNGEIITHGAELIEDRLIEFTIDLPFEVPVNSEMTEFKMWKNASEDEKRIVINLMDSKLRDKINSSIAGEEELTEEEVGN